MDNNAEKVLDLKIERTVKALARNNMEAFVADNCEQAVEIVKSLMKEGDSVTCGGSVTLKESGVRSLMESGAYRFIDRSLAKTPEEIKQVYRESFSADVYLTSANAITENGELYNVDGNSNRIAAIAYGPDRVIVVAGVNKLVRSLDEAIVRVKSEAAPPNTVRLQSNTPCAKTGECVSLSQKNGGMCSGCASEARICCNYLVSAYQRHEDRIKVVIVKEKLGY
jgi:L-lactate utilization protein LutB